ncbi:MAG: bifunctional alpha/beta hydrolase/OsmC family protein [Desulfobacterales bacterium]|jgi:putative redox protein|nr:bifunctional alpha/beta hydrolase/OsmC family protein [Desulfobacterales bacterium]
MQLQKFEIAAPGGQRLSAILDLPVDGAPIAFAIFAHCFTCSKDLKAVYHISRTLTRERIGVLRFDFTGLGESSGDFADTSLRSNVNDLIAAAEFLTSRFEGPRLLIGHSFGGAAVLQAAAAIPTCRAVVTIAAPADPRHVFKTLGSAAEAIASRGEAEVTIAGRPFTLRKKFLDDLAGIDPEAAIRDLNRALLVMHSPLDEVVGIENAARIFQVARHPKSFVSLDQADHLLSNLADSRYAGAVIAAWARRYLASPAAATAKRPAADQRITARTGPGGFLTEILVNRHSLVADEPVQAGGTDQGPSPFDLLVAALGACTAMTLRMYADRKSWPLEAATVRLTHDKIHAADCETCETREGMLDRIEREIEIEGPLDADQKQRLLQIADRCPVHRTLTSEVQIKTRLKA